MEILVDIVKILSFIIFILGFAIIYPLIKISSEISRKEEENKDE